MANPYADPTSIDYILQRAQDELRRGGNQHYRAAEAQYTNHVRELLGNLERYLETCGVQLPAGVITGTEAAAAVAAASTINEVDSEHDAARSSPNNQVQNGSLGTKHSYPSPPSRSLSASVAVENVRGSRGSTSGWGTLATPTAAQQLDHAGDDKRAELTSVAAAIQRIKSKPAGAGLTISRGSSRMCSPVSPKQQQEVAGRRPSADAEDLSCRNMQNNAVGSSHHTPPQEDRLPSPPGDVGGNLLPVRPQQDTMHTESQGHSGDAHVSLETASAHARSVSLNAVAAGSGVHVSSGADQWGDFGQFVQSITESRMNSNFNSLQSAAAAASPTPAGYTTNTGNTIPPITTITRSHESTTTTTATVTTISTTAFAVSAALLPVSPEIGFQLPHVLVTASSSVSPPLKDLQHAQQQQQQVGHRGISSPLDVGGGTSTGAVLLGSVGAQDVSTHLSHEHPTTTTTPEVMSIRSHSPSLSVQPAHGTGNNDMLALAAASTGASGEKKSPVEHVPSPSQQRRATIPQVQVPTAVLPMQRAASLPVADYLPYGKGGSPFYPHILRVGTSFSLSTSRTHPNSPSQMPSRKSSVPAQAVPSPPPPPPQLAQQSESAVEMVDDVATEPFRFSPPAPPRRIDDAETVTRSQEKEQLMRRMRGVLDKASLSPPVTPPTVVSFARTGRNTPPSNATNNNSFSGGEMRSVQSPQITAPYVATVSPSQKDGTAYVGGFCPSTTTELPWQGSAHAVGAAHPPVVARSTVALPPAQRQQQKQQLLDAQSPSLLSDGADRRLPNTGQVSSNAPHADSLTRGNVQLNTPSSKDTGSLPTGLSSVSQRMLPSHDLNVGGFSSDSPRSSSLSPHRQQRQCPQPVSSYTTAYSTTATTYRASTVAPPRTVASVESPSSRLPPDPHRDGRFYSGGGAAPGIAGIDTRSRNDIGVLPGAEVRNGGGGSPHSNGEARQDEKHQLMQRLRAMLSR
ncbi:hypothetical protein N2W54_000106 [Lotmaria passim]